MKSVTMIFLSTVMLIAGCSTPNQPGPAPSGAAKQTHAECAVCKVNADLACLDVAVDDSTPKCDYNGKTYYFCSEECKEKFAKKPEKYAGK